MKKIFALTLLFIMTLTLTACSASNIFDFILVEDSNEFLTMVTSADWPPFEFITFDERGRQTVRGVDIELGKAIAKNAGMNLRVIHKGFDFLIEDVRSGAADMAIAALTPTTERRQVVDFSYSYFDSETVVVVRNSDLGNFATLDDLNNPNIRVGAQLGSLQQFLLEETAPNANMSLLQTGPELLQFLVNGNLDAVIFEEAVFNTSAADFPSLSIALPLHSAYSGYSVITQQGNTELMAIINQTILELRETNEINYWFDYYSNFEHPEGSGAVWSWANISLLLNGLLMTIIFALLAVALGALLALVPAFMRISGSVILRQIATWYIEIIRGTPIIVQVFIFYALIVIRPIPFMGIDLGAFIPGLIALVVNCSAYIAEIIRGGIQSVDKGQTEASRSLGMSNSQTMFKVILPQAVKKIIPSLGNEFVTIIKETSIFMFLGVAELMFQVRIIQSRTFRSLEVFLVAGVLYLLITIPVSKLMNHLERKLKYESK